MSRLFRDYRSQTKKKEMIKEQGENKGGGPIGKEVRSGLRKNRNFR